MAEKYLVWPIRIFLYILAIFITSFYSICLFMTTEFGARYVAKNIFQENLNFEEIQVQPSLIGIKIDMKNISFNGAAEFYGDELSLEINFINSIISKKIYIPFLNVKNSEVRLFDKKSSLDEVQPNIFIDSVDITDLKIGNATLKKIKLQKFFSEEKKFAFSFKDLDLTLPKTLKNIKNIGGIGYFSDNSLSLIIENENAFLDFDFYESPKYFQKLRGYLLLDFNDRFSVPYGIFSSTTDKNKLNVSFKYSDGFELQLKNSGNFMELSNLIPDTLVEVKNFLNKSKYSSNDMKFLLSAFLLDDALTFSSVTSSKNNNIRINDLDVYSSQISLYVDNSLLRINGDDLELSNFTAKNFSLSKNLSLNSPYSLLIDEENKFSLEISESGDINGVSGVLSNIENNNIKIVLNDKKALINLEEIYFHFDFLENLKFSDNILTIFPQNFKSNYFMLSDNAENFFDFNLKENAIENLNIEIKLNDNFKYKNLSNFKFDELNIKATDSYMNFENDKFNIGGLFKINGKNISYSDSTFKLDALRVLSLIDIRSRLLNIINADFEKLDQNNFFINDLEGEFLADSSGYANINKLNLNFDAGNILLGGTVFSTYDTFDTFDLDLTFSTKLSQNIPWYVAIIGGFPAAAGAVVVTDILQNDINAITKTHYSISGNVDNLEVSVNQKTDDP
tara:strand:+ start:487 stop:2520 length:2034 start_codon:yes stop_codon:yes gene_type:complete